MGRTRALAGDIVGEPALVAGEDRVAAPLPDGEWREVLLVNERQQPDTPRVIDRRLINRLTNVAVGNLPGHERVDIRFSHRRKAVAGRATTRTLFRLDLVGLDVSANLTAIHCGSSPTQPVRPEAR